MSKLNPQKASAYVGPGVLRRGGKITPVPNGPLIKKKGPFKGSTLKAGGVIKKAQAGKRVPVKSVSTLTAPKGTTVDMKPTAPMPKLREYSNQELQKNAEQQIKIQRANRLSEVYHKSYDDYTKNPKHWLKPGLSYDGFMEALKTNAEKNAAKNRRWDWLKSDGGGSSGGGGGAKSPCKGGFCPGLNSGSRNGSTIKKAKAGTKIKKAQNGEYVTQEGKNYIATKKVKTKNGPRYYQAKSPNLSFAREVASFKERANPSDSIPKVKLSPRALEMMNKKNGGMLKRADGSYSKRGLWDNIRANKGSGKKPTKQMLVQEKKIKAKSKK
jgi:hypothetical protein